MVMVLAYHLALLKAKPQHWVFSSLLSNQWALTKPNLLCMHNQIDVISPFIYFISFKLQFAHLICKGREIVRQRRC